MAKFIIEVDDDFIRQNADPDRAKRKLDPEGTGGDMIRVMFDMIAYSTIARRLDAGQTEFHVSRDMMDGSKNTLEYWDRNISDVLMLAFMAEKGNEERKV